MAQQNTILGRVIVKSDGPGFITLPNRKHPSDAARMIADVGAYLEACAQGARSSNVIVNHNPVAAQATVTLTGAGTANDTITIGPVTVTLKASGATGDQINIGGTAALTAAALNTFINAGGNNGDLAGTCTSSINGAVLTLTCVVPGTIGNGLTLSKSSTSITLTNLWGASVAGTDGTQYQYSLGL